MANIKISQLPSIGNGLSASTILPVVNTTGTLTTDKVAVGNIANFILTQAGNTLPPAFVANVAYGVANAAQPNITSVGTLTRLTIGNVANLTIPGGTNGYVLQTDGAGNLSWVAGGGSGNGEVGGSNSQLQFNNAGSFDGDASLTWDAANAKLNTVNLAASEATIYGNVNAVDVLVTGNVVPNAIYTDHYYYSNGQAFSGGGNGTPGGSNTQVQFNDGGNFGGNTGFTFNKTTGIFTSPFLAGNGNGLSNIQGANVSGAVTYATTANTVAGGNVVGAVQYATTANSVAVANVVGIGNIATLALDGNTSNVLYGNGVFAPVSGGGNPFDQDLNTTDNVEFANVTSTEAIKFSNSGNLVGALGYAPAYVSIEGYGSNTVNITTNDVFTWSFGETGTLTFPVSSTSIFGGIDNDFTIATSNANGATYYFTFGQFGDLSVPANLNVSGNVYTPDIIGYGNGNVTITADANSWLFETDGILTVPGGGQIVPVSNTGVRLSAGASDTTGLFLNGAGDAEIYANANVSIYTDAGNVGWTFDNTGNLTLPGNSSSINYANGTPYGGGGGSGYIIPYEVATFVANTQPGFGEIQFANNEGANSAPATAQKLFINESPTNEQSMGTIFQQWTSNSYRGTLSLNNGSDSQATFNISNGRIYFEPETYRGFQAGLNQIWGDDCSINQLIITNASAPKFYNTDFLVEDDVFHATGLATGNTHVMLNIYGSSQYNPINPNDLWNTFVAFVDNVLYDGSTLRTNPDDIKTQFYNNTGSFRNNIPTQDLFQYFRFTSSSDADYFGTAPTTTNGSGTGATVRIRVNPNNTYTVLGTALPGVGYIGGETLTVLGTDLGGATPDNDLTILIDSVDGDGVITAVSYDSGTGVYPWPSNSISDGSDDQYDVGNYLNTNLASEISYANGITQTASAAFGGGDYCVMYYQSFFCMVATGVSSSVSDLFYSGNLGFDGDGDLNWTGLRSNQSVIANNNALYAYFDSEYLDGELTPTVGVTYNMVLDSAGINLDGFYAYNDDNTGDTFFGSNTDWRVESQSQLYVQSYNDMIIQTLVNQRGIGETGPALTVQAGDGSPGQKEINATAGNGGTVNVRGGDAGGSDGIDSLGNTGGSVNITGGVGSGNSQAGNVEINGGEGNNSGSINLRTDYGSNSTGKITLNTGGNGTTNTWEFRPDGSTIFPTLTVDIHNGGNQQAQTLQFGDNTQQAIITGPTPDVTGSAQRLIIQGQRGSGTGEGGDVYLWAGDSDLYGGDIKIYAGDADNVSSGSGGYVNIAGGDGFDLGGYVSMQGGQSSNGQGAYAQLVGGYGLSGGFANIVGGQGYAGPGGNVNITGGTSGNGLAEYGNVNIGAGASTWTFDNTGNLVLPGNTFSVNYANGTQVNIGGGSGNTGNVTFDDVTVQGVNQLNLSAGPDYTANLAYLQVRAGDVASHIHFDTGNNEAYDLIVGNDSKYVQVSSTGNIIMSSYDGNTSYTMKLDTTGNVTFPGVLGVAGGTATAVPVTNESGIPGGAGDSVITGTVASNPGIDTVQPGWTVTGNNLTATTTVTSVVESSPNFYTITTDTNEVNPFTYNDVYTFTSPGISNWVFANDNTLTFPRDEIANTDPYLRIEGGTNPRILSEDASLAGPANLEITALNTIFTGSSGDEIRIYPDDGEIGSTGNLQLWANAGSNVAQYNWTFDTTGNLTVPGNTTVSTANATSGAAGKNISVIAGAADQSDYYTTSGGNVNITGGLGATNDGGGGGPGGWVNITSGASADPAGHNGNVKINTGGSNTWTFDYTGNLTTSSNLVISPSGIGTGTAIAQSDAILQIASTDANGSASIGWYGNPTGPGNVVQVALNQTGGSMTVVTGDYSDTTYVWNFDNAGNLTLPTGGELHATGKIGYTSGGTVTQTGTGQGVTINQLTGQITLAKSSWTAGDLEIFNVNCNKVGTYDYVMAQVINGTESTFFNVVAFPYVPLANSFQIQVRALETTTSTPLVQFYIMKAAIS